jgi:hypothetical protein
LSGSGSTAQELEGENKNLREALAAAEKQLETANTANKERTNGGGGGGGGGAEESLKEQVSVLETQNSKLMLDVLGKDGEMERLRKTIAKLEQQMSSSASESSSSASAELVALQVR